MSTIRTHLFEGTSTLPLVLEPASTSTADTSVETLATWIRENQAQVSNLLRDHGALLFRGFGVRTPADFEKAALALEPNLGSEYLGTSPRLGVGNTKHVFSASELPGYYPIPQHCEMTFVKNPPKKLIFSCLVPVQGPGGETPLVDFRKVWAELDPAVRDRFVQGGFRIIRNYEGPEGAGRFDFWKLKRWDEIFGTTDRAMVEAKCAEAGFVPEWLARGRLRLVSEQPAMQPHPETGVPVWFSHVQVFHLGSAPAEYERIWKRMREPRLWGLWQFSRVMVAMKRRAPSIDQSMHVTYADGREIDERDLEHLRDVIWKNLVAFPWQLGDIVAIDNRSVSHGRMPYRGPREIVVAWS